MRNLLGLSIFFTASLSVAMPLLEETLFITNTEVSGRLLTHSCSYYTNTEANLRILFKSLPVDYGTRVFLEYGWEKKDLTNGQIAPWEKKAEKEMSKKDASSWTVDLTETVAERSSSFVLTGLQFVFRIEEPGKQPRYQAGPMPRDTYIASLPALETASCVGPNRPNPMFEIWTVQIVRP